MAKRSKKLESSKAGKGTGRGTTVAAASPTFLERYRNAIIVVVVVAVIGVVGFAALQSSSTAAYECESMLTVPPSASTDPNAPLGFLVEDSGRSHSNAMVKYASCPPTSGDHRADGALPRRFYGPGTVQIPNDWVHNLEHGYAVIAYKGDPGTAVLSQIRSIMDNATPSGPATACNIPNKVIALRFDDMEASFAVLAWDRALLLDTFDAGEIASAVDQFQDQPQAPEQVC